MLYFSELQGKKVFTEDGVSIGRLEDMVFLASENPKITKIVVRDKYKNKLFIPTRFLIKINDLITIKKNYLHQEIVANELFLLKNLLDKQIIDLGGNKIVRVNDIAIQNKPFLCVAGVDIGILGILRRLKIEDLIIKFLGKLGFKFSSRFLSWGNIQPLELSRGHVKLNQQEKKLEKIRPEDLADHLEKTNILNVRKILKLLDDKKVAEIINYLNINYQTALFRYFRPEKATKIISLIDPDEAVDILLTCSKKKREEILNMLDDKKKKELTHLLSFSKTSIGGIMTTEYITVSPEDTVIEVIKKIKKEAADFYFLNYIYVVNKEKQLVGVFNLHELLINELNTPVYKFMIQNIIVIHLTTPQQIALKKMLKYKLAALPVIDKEKYLLGIVTIDDLGEIFLNKIR